MTSIAIDWHNQRSDRLLVRTDQRLKSRLCLAVFGGWSPIKPPKKRDQLSTWINQSGWWFGTCFIFPYIGNNQPIWLIFFEWDETTNQSRRFVADSSPKSHLFSPASRLPRDLLRLKRWWQGLPFGFCIVWTPWPWHRNCLVRISWKSTELELQG